MRVVDGVNGTLTMSAMFMENNSDGAHTGAPKPERPTYRFRGELPAAYDRLRERKQWVTWKYVWKAEKKKWDKPPHSAHTGKPASINNPDDLGTFDEAAETAARLGMEGVGYVLQPDDDVTGGDLDDCIIDTGTFTPLAAEVLGYRETYAETSPSGEGIRWLALGKPKKNLKDDTLGVEIYGWGRYLTVTANQIGDSPDEIRPAPRTQAHLEAAVAAAQEKRRRKANGQTNVKPASGVAAFWDRVNAEALDNLEKAR
jgi:primase-polymerase (primpol)-like protein